MSANLKRRFPGPFKAVPNSPQEVEDRLSFVQEVERAFEHEADLAGVKNPIRTRAKEQFVCDFLSQFKSLRRIRRSVYWKGYLWLSAMNALQDEMEEVGYLRSLRRSFPRGIMRLLVAAAEKRPEGDKARMIIQELPPLLCQIVGLRVLGRRPPQIANSLGIPVRSIKKSLAEGLKILKRITKPSAKKGRPPAQGSQASGLQLV